MNEYTSTLRSDSKRGSPFNKSTFPAQFKLSTDQNDGDKKKPELAAPFKTFPDSEGEDLLSAKGDKKAKSDTSRAPRKSNKPTTITPLAHGYYIFRFSISSPRGNVRQIICFDLHSFGLSSLYYRLYILFWEFFRLRVRNLFFSIFIAKVLARLSTRHQLKNDRRKISLFQHRRKEKSVENEHI